MTPWENWKGLCAPILTWLSWWLCCGDSLVKVAKYLIQEPPSRLQQKRKQKWNVAGLTHQLQRCEAESCGHSSRRLPSIKLHTDRFLSETIIVDHIGGVRAFRSTRRLWLCHYNRFRNFVKRNIFQPVVLSNVAHIKLAFNITIIDNTNVKGCIFSPPKKNKDFASNSRNISKCSKGI